MKNNMALKLWSILSSIQLCGLAAFNTNMNTKWNRGDISAYYISESGSNVSDDFVIEDGKRLVQYTGTAKSSITIPEQIEEIAATCFMNHTELVEITLPERLHTIGMMAFYGCQNLKQIVLPSSVSELGQYAFSSCTNLTDIDLSSTTIQSVRQCTFMNCIALEEIVLPDSLLTISGSSFESCTKLKRVYTGKSLERIESDAFSDCADLELVALPDTVRFIDPAAFTGCDEFIDTHTENSVFAINQILICCTTSDHVCKIPDGIVAIINNAFAQSKAVAVICPASLRYIREDAFSDNSNVIDVQINEECVVIEENAFSNCRYLTKLTVPSNVTEIGVQPKSSLTDIYGIPGTAAERFAAENNLVFHDNTLPKPDMTLDYTSDSWSFDNSSGIFGSEYYLTDADRQRLIDFGFNPKDADTSWSGSCVGLAVSVILAKNGIFTPSQLQSGTQSLAEIEPTEAVQSFINYFQCIQGRGESSQGYESRDQQFYRMLKIAQNIPNGESPFLLTFSTQTGSHGVVGYGQESGIWEYDGRTYDGRILIWDSNFPNTLYDESCLYYDSETFAYCIPSYKVYMAESDTRGGIITVCNDLDVLNAYPYLFRYEQGDINKDGVVEIADAVLLARVTAEDDRVTQINWDAADVDADGLITIMDVMKLLKNLAS